jgi:Restriction endonuclease
MMNSLEKGNALERAVQSIEHTILRTSPALKEKTFLIESKKIICVGGVHHEIDVFVTIDPAPGYQSVSIFECKNWKEPIGKNEIINFSEKIKAAGATRGFFVAKEFTRDAEAQAKKDNRMELILATELPLEGPPMLYGFHMISVVPVSYAATFFKWGATGSAFNELDMETARFIYRGEQVVPRDFLLKRADPIMKQDTAKLRTERFAVGTYPFTLKCEARFEHGELFVDDIEVERLELEGAYTITVHRPPIISHFDVATRGRSMTFAPVEMPPTATFQVTLSQKNEGGSVTVAGHRHTGEKV